MGAFVQTTLSRRAGAYGRTTMAYDFESKIVSIPDYPTPGVIFKDVTTLFKDAEAFGALVDEIAEAFEGKGITKVVGAEARGFMLGAPVAYRLKAGFVPARKPGKLPRATISEDYALEYGTATLELHEDALDKDEVKLVERLGARVAGLAFLMELEFLHPRQTIAEVTDAEVFSAVKVK